MVVWEELRQASRLAGLGRGDRSLRSHTASGVPPWCSPVVGYWPDFHLHCCNPRLTSSPQPQTIPALTC